MRVVTLLRGLKMGHFEGVLNLNTQKQWTGLAQGKDNPLSKEVMCLGGDLPS